MVTLNNAKEAVGAALHNVQEAGGQAAAAVKEKAVTWHGKCIQWMNQKFGERFTNIFCKALYTAVVLGAYYLPPYRAIVTAAAITAYLIGNHYNKNKDSILFGKDIKRILLNALTLAFSVETLKLGLTYLTTKHPVFLGGTFVALALASVCAWKRYQLQPRPQGEAAAPLLQQQAEAQVEEEEAPVAAEVPPVGEAAPKADSPAPRAEEAPKEAPKAAEKPQAAAQAPVDGVESDEGDSDSGSVTDPLSEVDDERRDPTFVQFAPSPAPSPSDESSDDGAPRRKIKASKKTVAHQLAAKKSTAKKPTAKKPAAEQAPLVRPQPRRAAPKAATGTWSQRVGAAAKTPAAPTVKG